jgi:mannosyltransferase
LNSLNRNIGLPSWPLRTWKDACSGSVTRVILLLMLIALCLRLPHLSGKSLWLDEISSLTFAEMRWDDFWSLVQRHEGNMIAYYLLLRAWIHLGDNRVVAKLLSILFGVLTVPAIYALGKELYDRRIGLIAACLLTVSACHVRASQWIRSYSLMLLLLVLTALFLARSLRQPSLRNWAMYTVCAALAVYNHLYAVLAIAAQLLSLILIPARDLPWKRLLLAVSVLGVFLTPAVAYVLFRNSGQLDWVPAPKAWELVHWAVFLAGAGSTGVAYVLLVICIAIGAIAVSGFRKIWAANRRSLEGWRAAFPFVWLVLPVGVSFLFSYFKPVFFFRYLIICLPAFLLVVALGIARWRASRLRTVILAVALGLSLTSVVLAYKTEEDWDNSIRYLLDHASNGDPIFPGAGGVPLEYLTRHWYAPGGAPQLERPNYAATEARAAAFSKAHPTVWLIVFPNFAPEPQTVNLWAALRPYYAVTQERKFRAVTIQRLDLRHVEH